MKIVHVVGTGTIGEPLIGLLADNREHFGIDEVTFHKRTPLLTEKAKVADLEGRGAVLSVDEERFESFHELGHTPKYEAREAIERATVVIDCTPVGNGIDWKMGVFDTIIGYEVFESGNNPNFTRSYGYAIEPTQRGPYAGAVGYVSYSGTMDSCITIRTIVCHGNRASIQVGAGIVADSDPKTEWLETSSKARGLILALRMAAASPRASGWKYVITRRPSDVAAAVGSCEAESGASGSAPSAYSRRLGRPSPSGSAAAPAAMGSESCSPVKRAKRQAS